MSLRMSEPKPAFGGTGAKPIMSEPKPAFGGTGAKPVMSEPNPTFGKTEAKFPLDPKDASYYGKKYLNDVPVNERHWYINAIRGYKHQLDIMGYERPIRYVTKTEAYYLTNGSPPEVTSIIMEPIAKSFYRYPTEAYLNKLEEVIIIAVPDEERSAYPSYDPLW
jgi:hypothetical protein